VSEANIQATAAPWGAPLQDQTHPPQRILVVDDEAIVRVLIAGMLGQSGYDVDAAEDGADAWEALQVKHYDLLITDNNMPKLSGVELIQRLHDAHTAMPVIMATGSFPEEELAESRWIQPFATLLKPFAIADLLEKVRAFLPAGGGASEQIDLLPDLQCQASPNV
jgi:two-component system, OmpR family, alkaline phosphatase synthesis response regulator PhoP